MAEAEGTMWHQTDQINMSVQTADISLDGFDATLTLKINCNLKNIARGQCAVTIRPIEAELAETADKTNAESQTGGQLHIFVDRPLMAAELTVSKSYFDQLTGYMNKASNRPIELILKLEDTLAVSIDGDLRIDSETIIAITGISINIPVK